MHDLSHLRQRAGSELAVNRGNVAAFDVFLTSWASTLRDEDQVLRTPETVGWDKTWRSFTFADRMLRKDAAGNIEQVPLHGRGFSETLRTMGTLSHAGKLAPWQQYIASLLGGGHPEAHVILAMSFAACLVDLVPDPPATAVVSSQRSGIGKTTMLNAANSVWFHHDRSISLGDTENYINTVVMASRHVPIFWDELQVMNSSTRERDKGMESVTGIIFRALQGADKGRLSSAATVRDKRTNRPLVCIASNLPLAEMLAEFHHSAPAAMSARVLQMEITTDLASQSPLEGSVLRDNYGVAGEAFVRKLMSSPAGNLRQQLQERLGLVARALDKESDVFAGQGRMWRSLTALSIIAAHLVRLFGIVPQLDPDIVKRVLVNAAERTRQKTSGAIRARDAFSSLNDIIADITAQGMFCESQAKPRQRAGHGTLVPASGNELRLWVCQHDNWARIRVSVLKELMQRKRLAVERVIAELLDANVLDEAKLRTYDPFNKSLKAMTYDIHLDTLRSQIKTP